MIEELLYYNNIEPKVAPSNSTFESWGQSQDLEGTIARGKARYQRPKTPSTETTTKSRSKYLLNRKLKPAAVLPSIGRELVHDTADDLADEEDGLDVWVGVYSPLSTSDNGQDLPTGRSQEDQIRQIRRLQFFSGVDGGLRLDGISQDGQATETPIDWASFYSDQSESVPRENFFSVPSTDWSIFSDDCPVTSTVTKPVPQDSYLSGAPTDWATLSADCPITTSVSTIPALVELTADSPVSPATPDEAHSGFPGIDELMELEGDMPVETPSLILWSQPERPSSKKVKGYVAKLRHRYLVEYKGGKDPINTPSFILDCPKEIVLTQPTPPATAEESKVENISRGMLAVPARMYKKKQREQQLRKESVKMEDLRIRRLSTVSMDEGDSATR